MDTECNCGTQLLYDDVKKCWHCPRCRPRKKLNRPEVKLDEARVRAIFNEMWDKKLASDLVEVKTNDDDTKVVVPVEETYREQAKRLGIPLNQDTGGARKKQDVLDDIALKTKESQTG